ncbi:MAG: hypothetical protein A3I86_00355 [Candidatus Zambryskibacteria bacterium RIFCSPLOWO2_02_FULL_39_14]|uniref:PDZ domain-containing protein n=1 Tax=Candidatus Zambryskibacteria bacterium RIFCSPLOWO2_02_FULL_39_14 TaxID=1802769 RepID=A0A1G2UGR9_9BACT|nr:MAG: hypothetical protein A3I86_00355 [Candidatus Zambryskibacteria bacterium RIFCSPLOWO2_02_FULL_39_14]
MSVIIFIIILSALIIVHEMGHFLVAKKFGIRVDEFGLGFPPKARTLFMWKNTPFTLNWLPFGGFVKIFGENPLEGETKENADTESFVSKNRGVQASVLAAGVFGNFLFAWALISLGFLSGLPAPVSMSLPLDNARTVITTVLPGSPAADAGLKSGDAIVSVSRDGNDFILIDKSTKLSLEEVSNFISQSFKPITFTIERGKNISEKIVAPEEGIIANKPAVGISMDIVGTAKLAPHKAIWYGFTTTSELTWLTGKAIGTFILQALGGRADLSGVTGPVGIVGMVGDVRELGFSHLLTFTALISINLAIINLLPFPALDGGRLLFVGIEAITRRSIPSLIFNTVNTIGFALLILLMILITIQDVRNIL